MVGRALTLVALLVALAGCDPVTVSPCTRENEEEPCVTGTTSARVGQDWVITSRVAVTEEVGYVEGGARCVRYVTYCQTRICSVRTTSEAEALQFCRSR